MINISYIIGGVIVLIGIFYFIFSIWKSRRLKRIELSKPEPIKHYEEVRDKLTLARDLKEQIDKEYSGGGLHSNKFTGLVMSLVTLGIVIVIGTFMLNSIGQTITQTTNESVAINNTTAFPEIMTQTTGIFNSVFPIFLISLIIIIIGIFIAMMIRAFGSVGFEL